MTVAYNKDPSPAKLNLGVGAYRTEVSPLWTEFNYCFVIFCVSSDKYVFSNVSKLSVPAHMVLGDADVCLIVKIVVV